MSHILVSSHSDPAPRGTWIGCVGGLMGDSPLVIGDEPCQLFETDHAAAHAVDGLRRLFVATTIVVPFMLISGAANP